MMKAALWTPGQTYTQKRRRPESGSRLPRRAVGCRIAKLDRSAASACRMHIRSVAVLGAGTMGAQIAAHFANAGVPSLLLDVTPERRDRA